MDFIKIPCAEFVEVLASKEPVPGGGGASALVGAIGTALGNMVGSLTTGKAKYADVEDQIQELISKSKTLQERLLGLVEEDAKCFEPLAKAYGLPANNEAQKAYKMEVMESALRQACTAPVQIMKACGEAIDVIDEFAKKGSVLAISDAGVGALFCKAALSGASLNIYINTKAMKDREYATKVNDECDSMLEYYQQKADAIFGDVLARLR